MDVQEFFDMQNLLMARRIRYVLSAEEYKLALRIGKERNKKQPRFRTRTYGDRRHPLEIHISGACCEVALAGATCGTIDETIFEDRGDDGSRDVTTRRGVLLGCKGTHPEYWDDPYLRVETHHFSDKVSLYVCCYHRLRKTKEGPQEVWLLGSAPPARVKELGGDEHHKRRFVDEGPMNYVLYERELDDLYPLLEEEHECRIGA